MNIAGYKKLEDRIKGHDINGVLVRWEVGRQLLKERGTAKRLPNGRLKQLSNALGSSEAELSNRMQFAAEYDSEEKVRAAYTIHGSWYAICARGLGDRRQFSADEGPVAEDELALAGIQRDLEAWKLLDRNALVGLSNLESRAVVTGLRRAYDLYCEDPARFKESSWTEQPSTSELKAASAATDKAGPEAWTHDGAWYPLYTVSPAWLRARAIKVITDLREGRTVHRDVPRHFDLWGRVRVPLRTKFESTPFYGVVEAIFAFFREVRSLGYYRRYSGDWEMPEHWCHKWLLPATLRVDGHHLVLESESFNKSVTPESKVRTV
ncbi:MAG TPA: hypothetical protein VN908_06540 [Gemmatimonadales bacterium]|nr:hypothetical protein [Gemmatimonadales bacterium]